jgi:hypothetical protein
MTKKISKRTTKGRSKTRRSRGGKKTKKNYRRKRMSVKRMSVKRMSRKMKGGEKCFDRYGDIDSYGGLYDEDGDRNLNCPNVRDYVDEDDDDYNTKRYGK